MEEVIVVGVSSPFTGCDYGHPLRPRVKDMAHYQRQAYRSNRVVIYNLGHMSYSLLNLPGTFINMAEDSSALTLELVPSLGGNQLAHVFMPSITIMSGALDYHDEWLSRSLHLWRHHVSLYHLHQQLRGYLS